ncbi:unnamed protein product [Amaranthus hypochondriacus]
MPTDRSPNRRSSEVGDKDRDRNREHRFQEAKGASYVLNNKTNGLGEKAKDSDTTAVPHSRSYVQVFLLFFSLFYQHQDFASPSFDESLQDIIKIDFRTFFTLMNLQGVY